MPTVVVAGALANKPGNGGEAWVRLSWVRGLQQLGCDVWFVEQLAEPGDPEHLRTAACWFHRVVTGFGLEARAELLVGDRPASPRLAAALRSADLLVNISGHLSRGDLLAGPACRAYVDIDPGYTQHWHAQGLLGDLLDRHDVHVTIGARIGAADCAVPTGGITWQHVRQPVVLADWPVTPVDATGAFTTVGSLRGPYGPVVDGDRTYGLKVHELRKVRGLPARVPEARLELALAVAPEDAADRQALLAAGWRLADPALVAGTPEAFRRYVQASAAELSVAQGVYVETACGWFSDRTVRYLASGRPAVVQDTGFSQDLPVGSGLLAFRDADEAAAGVDAVLGELPRHAAAARALAEECFSAEAVLPGFLAACGVRR